MARTRCQTRQATVPTPSLANTSKIKADTKKKKGKGRALRNITNEEQPSITTSSKSISSSSIKTKRGAKRKTVKDNLVAPIAKKLILEDTDSSEQVRYYVVV